MTTDAPRFCIAVPDASQDSLLDATLRSLFAQEGDVDVRCIVNGAAPNSEVVVRWATREGLRCESVALNASKCEGDSTGDVLNQMFADVPYGHDVIMTSLPAGAELMPGTLANVARAMADLPEIDLMQGLTPSFADDGILTEVGLTTVEDAWLVIGAASTVTSDSTVVESGMFWRSRAWHRLGGMDPTLSHFYNVDFRSKVAAAFQTAIILGLLTVDRPRRLAVDEAGLKGAELRRVRERAVVRQARLLKQIRGEPARDVGESLRIKPVVRIGFDTNARAWQIEKPEPTLDRLGLVKPVFGFRDIEGPFPDLGLPNRFRWTTARAARVTVRTTAAPHRVVIQIRNVIANQTIVLFLNNEVVHHTVLVDGSIKNRVETNLVQMFKSGLNELIIFTEIMHKDSLGQALGIIVEFIEIVEIDV